MEVPTFSKTPKPTLDLSLDPKTTVIALVEIEPLLPASWSSFPSLNNSCHQETKQQTAKKFENLLKEMKDLLKNTKCYEKKITKTRESSEETSISEDVSELKEQISGLDKINKVLLKILLACLDLDKDQNSKKQEIISENQNSKDTQDLARDLVNHSEKKRAVSETQLSKDNAESRFHHAQEENIKLRNNMEQLLQEAEHWSVQHAELSELIKSYQKSQNDIRVTFKSNEIHFQTQLSSKVPANYELEAQVRKLNHDTHSLHLIAALLENECQLLQQRVELLKELRYQKDATLQEKPIQIHHEQDKKEQKLLEAGTVERYKQKLQDMEGTFQNKDIFYKSQDSCGNKKARKNRFNIRLARVLWRKKRPTSSLR